MPKKIYLIDGNNFIYRMFFALPEFTTKDGKIVNATFGMAKFFIGQLRKENPDYLIFIKDAKGENFRHKLYEDYKATRERMPDNLRSQIADIETMIEKMGIDIVEVPGYEADDVIGTLAKKYSGNMNYEIDILTGDKDLYSLVSENVSIYDTMKKKKFGPSETQEKFGIPPERIIDYLAICGDKADNIPGIDGFGPKKAIILINGIGSIEDIYKKLDTGEFLDLPDEVEKIFKGKSLEKLQTNRENAFLSKKLATIELGVDLSDFSIDNFYFDRDEVLNEEVVDFFENLEFYSLINKESPQLKTWKDTGLKVKLIQTTEDLHVLKNNIKKYTEVVIDTETTSLNIINAQLVGISIYLDDENIYYINRLHHGEKINDKELKSFLDFLFGSELTIIGHNLKYDLEILQLFKENSQQIPSENSQEKLGQMTFEI